MRNAPVIEAVICILPTRFPEQIRCQGAYRLYLPSDGLTIWYTITESEDGQVVIVGRYVRADT